MNKNIYMTIAALSLAISAGAEDIQFSQLPSAAQKTINRNLYGGIVQDIDQKTEAGRTYYDVEVRREGKNRQLRVDADGKLLAASKVGNVSADVDLDTDDNKVVVEADADDDDEIFKKNDGKILGIPKPGNDSDKDAHVNVEVDANKDHVATDVDGGVDTDKNDGRILGVPKRGFETLDLSHVPPVVRETIRREAGGYRIAEIEKANLDGRMVYEVDIERDGKNRELHVAADGTVLKDSNREAVGAPAGIERGTDRVK